MDHAMKLPRELRELNQDYSYLTQWTPERAGFVRVEDDGSVVAHGESISLKLKSDPKLDSKLLAKMLNK